MILSISKGWTRTWRSAWWQCFGKQVNTGAHTHANPMHHTRTPACMHTHSPLPTLRSFLPFSENDMRTWYTLTAEDCVGAKGVMAVDFDRSGSKDWTLRTLKEWWDWVTVSIDGPFPGLRYGMPWSYWGRYNTSKREDEHFSRWPLRPLSPSEAIRIDVPWSVHEEQRTADSRQGSPPFLSLSPFPLTDKTTRPLTASMSKGVCWRNVNFFIFECHPCHFLFMCDLCIHLFVLTFWLDGFVACMISAHGRCKTVGSR